MVKAKCRRWRSRASMKKLGTQHDTRVVRLGYSSEAFLANFAVKVLRGFRSRRALLPQRTRRRAQSSQSRQPQFRSSPAALCGQLGLWLVQDLGAVDDPLRKDRSALRRLALSDG